MRLIIPPHSRRDTTFPGGWTLYKLQEDGRQSFLWQRFKLMLPPGTPARRAENRAYYVTWNPEEQRFAKDGYLTRLQGAHPQLFAELDLHMRLEYGPGWLTDPDGGALTEAEIAEERARLKTLRAAATLRGPRRGRRRASPAP